MKASKIIKVGTIQINNSFAGQNYLPLSLGFLYSYAAAHVTDFDRFEFLMPIYKRTKISAAVEHLKDADIAAFSTYVWNNNLSLAIAKELKKVNPKCLVVFGGCHVPDNNTKEYLLEHEFIDIAAVGEGEKVFAAILENFSTKQWHRVPSISFRDQKGIIHTQQQCERIKDMNEIPSPFLEGYFDNLIKNNPQEKWIGLWETNRGCPFACTFCDWGVGFKKKVEKYDLEERLYLEADWFSHNKIEFIFCCDANFGIYKDRDYSIVERFAKNKKQYGYPHALSVQNTKNNSDSSYKVQKLLAETGLNKGVLIAFQSLYEPALKAMKRSNIKLKHFFELQKKFTREGIKTFSDLIIGLPEETYESFTNGVCTLISMGQHNRIQFNNLSILPNTEMAAEEYIQTYGLDLVESNIVNIHGTLEEDEIAETQIMVVGTKSAPGNDWVKIRSFGYMVGFLHFNKILQIPIVLLNSLYGIEYEKIFRAFLEYDLKDKPVLEKIRDDFYSHARKMQQGGTEFAASEKWLNIWWPPDELSFINIVTNQHLEEFYNDAKKVLFEILLSEGAEDYENIINEAILLNKMLIKLPQQKDDIQIALEHNIWEVYTSIINGSDISLVEGKHNHYINRSTDTWSSWDEWCQKVVWWGNKKGAYLYECVSEPIEASTGTSQDQTEPFGNDARYQ
tara:strand:+ start:113 stop:2143 length:2031 start_codon:yes stop_codon:yes gene_type:complete